MAVSPFDAREPEPDPYNRCGGYLSPAWLMDEEQDLQADDTERSDERCLPGWVRAGLLARRGLSETGRPV